MATDGRSIVLAHKFALVDWQKLFALCLVQEVFTATRNLSTIRMSLSTIPGLMCFLYVEKEEKLTIDLNLLAQNLCSDRDQNRLKNCED